MKSLQQFKTAASDKFRVEGKEEAKGHNDPISFLYSLGWDVPVGEPFPESEVNTMNLIFDERGCFGRAVKAAVLAEQYFPTSGLYAGEVCEDLLRTALLKQATLANWYDDTYIAEILQYENPHIALVNSTGDQFDPIFKAFSSTPRELQHPKVNKLPLWDCLYASYLISAANNVRLTDPASYSSLLDVACVACPDMILTKENLAGKHAGVGQWEEAIRYATVAAEHRKDAKILWMLWQMTDDKSYADRIKSDYHPQMLIHLNKTLMP